MHELGTTGPSLRQCELHGRASAPKEWRSVDVRSPRLQGSNIHVVWVNQTDSNFVGKRSVAETRLVCAHGSDADAYASTRVPLNWVRAVVARVRSLSRSPSIRSSSAFRLALVSLPPAIPSNYFTEVLPAWVVSGSPGRGVARSHVRSASRSRASCSSRAHARATPGSLTPTAPRQAETSRATQTLSAPRTSHRRTRSEFHDALRQ
jgi:hypothetical protein